MAGHSAGAHSSGIHIPDFVTLLLLAANRCSVVRYDDVAAAQAGGVVRGRIVHFNVTNHPTARWTTQQIVEAFPADGSEPRYLLRDRDGIYGNYFQKRVSNMGIRQILISPRSPWQNPYADRVIGSLRRECLNHVIVLSASHLKRILRGYVAYYNASRPHNSLNGNSPLGREIEPPSNGPVIAIPQVGGLHHRYSRAA